MKFRNYCIVVMGDTTNVLTEIEKMSEIKPNVLDARGILISTFSSVVEPAELKDYFLSNGRNFLLFDLNPKTSAYHIEKKEIQEGLFGFLKELNDEELNNKTKRLFKEISESSHTGTNLVTIKNKTRKITETDIDKMNTKEKEELLNQLIDKGPDNLTEYDKKLIKKLAI